MLRRWGMLVLALLVTPAMVFAQNTGKISGVVTDGETGDPLPGASVAVVGTTLGSISDVDGNYFIIGVPVGNYDVQASFVGYGTETRAGVDISSGYTRELNFELSPGVELDEIIVEYERPLIQKDAVGAPKIVSGEEIVNLPVRGAASVAAIQAGVVSREGSSGLNIRGGRSGEVTYYVDGVKVIGGTPAVPQSAVQEQEMIIGNISAKYGDAMSGVISITTKTGSTNYFGSFEGITSSFTDDYGYNLLSGTIGGPVTGENFNFFLSGEYLDQADRGPSAFGQLWIPDDIIADLDANPQALPLENAAGETMYVPIPILPDGFRMNEADGVLTFYDTAEVDPTASNPLATIDMIGAYGEGAHLVDWNPIDRAELVDPAHTEVRQKKRNNDSQRLALSGNLRFNPIESAALRLGGRFTSSTATLDGTSIAQNPFAVSDLRAQDLTDYQLYGTWTHYLSNTTFFQIQADYANRFFETYDPRFGKSRSDILNYGDITESDVHSTLRGYYTYGDWDGTYDSYFVENNDQFFPTAAEIDDIATNPGGIPNGYGESRTTQFRFQAAATTQIGIHQVEFGAEFERQTRRSWSLSARIAQIMADPSGAESQADERIPEGGFASLEDIPYDILNSYVGNRGYDLLGNEADNEDFDLYTTSDKKSLADNLQAFTLAPYEPIFYGGYLQDKIEFRDIVLNLGFRIDVFDNNQLQYKSQFIRDSVCLVGDIGGSRNGTACGGNASAVPANVGSEWTPFYDRNDPDAIYGYRDDKGNLYDANGQPTNRQDIGQNAIETFTPIDGKTTTPDIFTDYEPEVTFMPRIGVSFPVTDQALFFARYGVVSERPAGNNNASIASLQASTGGIANNALAPAKTTEYEIGFRQRIGARGAFEISGFFRQIENLLQNRDLRGSSPFGGQGDGYTVVQNVDFGTVKGLEFGFDLRRTNAIAANVNYTLSFADGSGSSTGSNGIVTWLDNTPPTFISPLDFDQRHSLKANIDYRLGQGEGPDLGGIKLLENFGVNLLFTAGSGFPYTPTKNALGRFEAGFWQPSGGINSGRFDWQNRIDLRVDRRFMIQNGTSLTAFVWVQNLLDVDNQYGGHRYTGDSQIDGWLQTGPGQTWIDRSSPLANDIYAHAARLQGFVGIPRITRVGVRVDF